MQNTQHALQHQKAIKRPFDAEIRHNILKIKHRQQRQQKQRKVVDIILHHRILIQELVQKQRTVQIHRKHDRKAAQRQSFRCRNMLRSAHRINHHQQHTGKQHCYVGNAAQQILPQVVEQQFVLGADRHLIRGHELVGIYRFHTNGHLPGCGLRQSDKMGISPR